MKRTLYLFFIFYISCHSKHSSDAVLRKLTTTDSLKAALIGRWGGLEEDIPGWEFNQDSVYYFERKHAYPYRIIGNEVIIKLPESEGHLRNMSIIKDTMIFYDQPGMPIKAYRFKQKNKSN